MMKFLYTLTAYPPSLGGAQLFTHKLVQQLMSKSQIQVITLWNENRTDWLIGTTLRMPEMSIDYEIDGIPVHRIGLSGHEKCKIAPYLPIYYPFMSSAIPPIASCLQKYLNLYTAQSNLIHNVRIGREPLSFASLQAARQYDIPFIFTPLHHPRWVGWRYRMYNKVYLMADAIIALTNAEKQALIDIGVQEEKIYVTGNGPILADQANPDNFLTTNSINGPFVLFLGQLYPYKGYKKILEATHLVWQKVPDVHFVFIGPSVGRSEIDFKNLADPRIHRMGKVDQNVKTDALAACTLLCVPSTQESFGGVYTEAWWFEKPVIGCSIPSVSEVVTDGVDGFLVEQKVDQIAERICDLLLNPNVAQRMGAAGRHKVKERYTWEKLAVRTHAIYQEVLHSSVCANNSTGTHAR